MTGKQVANAMKRAGWGLNRVHGSHYIFTKNGKVCPVPIHGKDDLPPGTLANIRRITGLTLR
jgi:predicted RNA binding protein YcfA (HicA-like mRNA interferase family)